MASAGAGGLAWAAMRPPAELSGTDFHLQIGAREVSFTGRRRTATAVNGQIPAPLLRWREGDAVTLRVTNRLPVPTSIHWHGVLVPSDMDGVPGLSFAGIAPGETFAYRFRVHQSGTYWYHSHSGFQEQTGLYGPIVIEPRGGAPRRAERDYTVLLSDWTDTDPERLYRLLKVDSEYFNFGRRTLGDFFSDARKEGLRRTLDDRLMWGRMRMDPRDLADVSGYAYTYLMNGATPADNWTGLYRRGERVRLRFINGSAMSFFDVRIPGLDLKVIAADGQDVEPVTVEEFRFGSGEVLDVIVEPRDDRAYTIFAQSLDRSGYARGTLAPRPGLQAQVPPLDPRPLLARVDMGMAERMPAMDGAAIGAGEGAGGMGRMSGMGGMRGMSGMSGMSGMKGMSGAGGMSGMGAMGGMSLSMRLDDPGVGLRGNGRRVLTYADLHTLGGPIDRREASREIEVRLTGDMRRFIWSLDDRKFSQSEPLRLDYGERVRLTLVNETMMNHPMHLHGLWSEVLSAQGEFLVRKQTVTVQPGQRIAYDVSANALGRWAYHCHLLYHMAAGMFREVLVGPPQGSAGATRSGVRKL